MEMKQKKLQFHKSALEVLNMIVVVVVVSLVFTACSSDSDPVLPDDDTHELTIDEQVSQMSLHQKICQMIFVRPEAMLASMDEEKMRNVKNYAVTAVTESMEKMNEQYPVGGFVLFAHNITDSAQLVRFTTRLHALEGTPMLCVDEEGGRVARIANNANFGLSRFASCYAIGHEGDYTLVSAWASYIGSYLKRYGLDVDLAPVADVWTNAANTVIGERAFSSDPDTAAHAAWAYYQALAAEGIQGCYKHFPGHGDTDADSHYGYAESFQTWAEMLTCEIKTFQLGIDNNIDMIMTAHILTPNATSDGLPASLSREMLTDKLRGELGFQGVIITDALGMGAIANEYTVEEAAVKAVQAGVDIVLMPLSLQRTVDAITTAVTTGTIPESRINESVKRILTLKSKRSL